MKKLNNLTIGAALLLVPVLASAESTGGRSDNISGWVAGFTREVYAIGEIAMALFFLGGLCLVGFGAYQIYADQKSNGQQGLAKQGMMALVIGGVLMALPVVAAIISGSVSGDPTKTKDKMDDHAKGYY
ncbi:hypothetical protein [Neptuniibacter sp. QD37_11]|uniref:hypothetical protein n=1 Tax=Neptuniibacter sp. QD37_11 TaxID=3398209 RepID=UPI0039F60E94